MLNLAAAASRTGVKTEMGTGISVVVITKNEEKNICDCLESVKWADEIIVVDSYSEDATVELSRRFTDLVVQKEWPGMVGTQRNVGLELATSEWILFLDADERVTPELKDELVALASSPKGGGHAGARLPRKNFFLGKWLRCSYPDYTARFLRRGGGRYNEVAGGGFDTMLFAPLPVAKLKQPLLHFTGETLAQRVKKLDFDSTLQAEEKYRAGKRAGAAGMALHSLLAFIKFYVLKRGFLDGTDGLIYAAFASFSTFVKYAKLWEKRQGEEH